MNQDINVAPRSRRISKRTVVALHSSAAGALQWKRWRGILPSDQKFLSPNLLGYTAEGVIWTNGAGVSLGAEAAAISAVVDAAGEPVDIIGHSYGGAVAIEMALRYPEKVASLILYEPVRFSVLRKVRDQDWTAILEVGRLVREQTQAGCFDSAARHFVDYWSGFGSWDAMSDSRKAFVSRAMPKVRAEFDALFSDTTPMSAYKAIKQDVLLLTGGRSPSPAGGVVQVLASVLPKVRVSNIEGLGHMGPIDAPVTVAAAFGFPVRELAPSAI